MSCKWDSVLLLVNLSLQAWDGIVTYYGLSLGVREGNPLLHACMNYWGVGATLIGAKSTACFFLVYLYQGAHLAVSQGGLLLTALSYFVFSFVPWGILLLS